MGRVLEARVTLVSAPAGFGKTTLVADWLATTSATVAWVSLDASDDDPRTFWRYVLASLDGALPGVGEQAIAIVPPLLLVVVAQRDLLRGLAAGASRR